MMSNTKTILVTASGSNGSNSLIRGIRASRYKTRIIGTNADRFTLTRSLADTNYLIPRGDVEQLYLESMNKIITMEEVNLVIANSDVEVGVLSRYRSDLQAPTLLPDDNTVRLCQDKFALNETLRELGFRVVTTYEMHSLEDIDEVFTHFSGADRVWCRIRKGSGSQGSLPVQNAKQARFWIDYWQVMRGIPVDRFILCEYLPGRDYAFQSLWKDGELVIARTCERISYLFGEKMPSGTSSTPRVGLLTNNHVVNSLCTRIVKALDPHANGMFCIDLKEDRHGVPCLTEINIGRFFYINEVFNSVGRYNMADLFLALAFDCKASVEDNFRFADPDLEETYLVREIDSEPSIFTSKQIQQRYNNFC